MFSFLQLLAAAGSSWQVLAFYPSLANRTIPLRALLSGRTKAYIRWPSASGRYVVAVRKPMDLPFDPIERAAAIWQRRFGEARAMAAVTSIMRAHQILLNELDWLLRPFGLTFARYEALVLLSFSRTGALPLRLIGERLMVHPTSVTNTINRLERAELVVRRPNPQDRRGTLAGITPAGREVVRQATAVLMAANFGLGDYDATQLDDLFGLLRSLRVDAGDFSE
jgi:DNA-binding MarR family transcriptional regulator